MNKKRSRKLVNTIIRENIMPLAIISIVLVLAISIAVNLWIIYDTEHEIKIAADSYKNYVEKSLTESISSISFLKSDVNEFYYYNKEPKSLDNLMTMVYNNSKMFHRIEILDEQGKVFIATPDKITYIGADRSSSDAFIKTMEGGSLLWSTPFTSEYNGQLTMTVSYKINNYTIIGYINFEKIKEITFDFERINRDYDIHIINTNGVYIYHSSPEYYQQRRINENFNDIKNPANINIIIKNFQDEENGTKKTAIIKKLEYTNWYLVIGVKNTITVSRIAFYHILILLTFVFVNLSVYYFSVKRGKLIVRSLSDLAEQTKKIAIGNYDNTISEQQFEEFDTLVTDFNDMSSEIKYKNEKLREIALTDDLTLVLNRNGFYIKINELISRSELNEFYILFMDIDNFKRVNDSYGHGVGDALLYELIKRFKTEIKQKILLARLGGDEFVICYSQENESLEIQDFAKNILQISTKPFNCLGKEIRTSVSIGISKYPDNSDNYDSLIQKADIALYKAKDSGKNTFVMYVKSMSEGLSANFAIEQSLKTALVKDEFFLVFQPQIHNGVIFGFEALLRWNSPQFGLVMPDIFIPKIEESNDIISVGRWVFDTACKAIKEINTKYNTEFPISVNFSSTEIVSENFYDYIVDTINVNDINPKWIGIEITEHVMMHSTLENIEMLQQLIDMGIEIILDDFGTGYSSLSHIGALPLNIVKLDRSFFVDIVSDEKRRKIVDSLITMIHNLDKRVIAEGVENKEQYDLLKEMDCDGVQGYYYSKPLKLEDLYDFIDGFNIA